MGRTMHSGCFRWQLIELPAVEGEAHPLGKLLAHLGPAGTELPTDGDDDLRFARGFCAIPFIGLMLLVRSPDFPPIPSSVL